MRLTVLGSGTLLPEDDRRSAAHLVESGDSRILLDCGAGTVHGFARHGVDWRRLTHLVVSHFHTDHVGDVAALLWALKHGIRPVRTRPFTVVGPPGIRRFMDALAAAHGDFVLDPGFPVRVVELEREDAWEDRGAGGRLACSPAHHTDAAVCWRVETDEGIAGYTGDTGEKAGMAEFLRGSHILVSECGVPDPPEVDTHLSPRGVAELARGVRPGLLLLTHPYPPLDPSALPDLVRAAGYDGEVVTAWDGASAVVHADGRVRLDRPGARPAEHAAKGVPDPGARGSDEGAPGSEGA